MTPSSSRHDDRPDGDPVGSDDAGDDAEASVRYFLIADVRGYTRFTQAHGDEAAAVLAARFAAVTRTEVAGHQGVLLELRGDEALVVFSSPRRAIRAAVALQDRFVEQTLSDPSVPLAVGIGLDAGEAVEVEGGYRGGALNLAARLCSAAGPGQVLASAEIVHLARAVAGVRYRGRGQMRFKGIAAPVNVVEVRSETEDPARERRFAEAVRHGQPAATRKRRRLVLAATAALVVLAASVVVWVVAPGGPSVAVAADSVAVVDVDHLKVLASVPVGDRPDGLAAGYGSVWTVNQAAGTVSRLDEATRQRVQTIPVGRSPRAVAVGPTGVWVTNNADRSVSWISPRTNAVVKTVAVGNAPTGVAIGRGSVWVTNSLDDTVSVIDQDDGSVRATVAVGRRPIGVSVGAGDVWVTNSGDGTLSRLAIASRSVTDTIAVGAGPEAVAVGAGGVWVANTLGDTVTHVDPSSDRVVSTIPAGKGPGGIAVTSGGVWVTSEYGGTLTRIDPARDRASRTLVMGGGPRGVVSVGGALWVTAAGSPADRRGGTLRLLVTYDNYFTNIDPQLDVFIDAYDGLLTYRRVDGPDGGTLVPDLATAIPAPSDAGRTYTFEVRRGIRYSDGRPVRASDFRRGLERVMTLDGNEPGVPDLYTGIVGGTECVRSPQRCHLTGVVTDDAARTVTIHLTEPDGDFLNKLAFPYAVALPPGTPRTPIGENGGRAVPATGPYMISAYSPGTEILMVRNPRFREWSQAAQPDGFPDRILITRDDEATVTTDILTNHGDLADDVPNLQELATRYPDQLHLDQAPFVFYAMLNTTVKPFDDHRAREAVALAIDREKLAGESSDHLTLVPTCRMLPPTFPAYQPGCPRPPSTPAEGTGPAGNLDLARQLVRASRTAADPVRVLSRDRAVTSYLVRLFKDLGYRTVTGTTGDPYDEDLVRQSNVVYRSYGAEYPAPAAVYGPVMGCGGFYNGASFCDHAFDRAVQAARQLQVTDPTAARAAWQHIEKTALADAAEVPAMSSLLPTMTSRRVRGYQHNAVIGILVDQMWVVPDAKPAG